MADDDTPMVEQAPPAADPPQAQAEPEAAPAPQPEGTPADPAPAAAPAAEPAPAPAPAPPNPLLIKYGELWAEVQAAPSDFTAWTNLIAAAEKLDDLEKIGVVYDTFLASYPLCYGYWKKYADAEYRHGSAERAIAVFERGVAATPYSIDVWVHYSNFLKSVPGTSPDAIRSVYERALAAVGTDYLSHSVWDKYMEFEKEQGGKLPLVGLYSRVLGVPLRDLDKYYHALRTLVQSSPVAEIMTEEEAAHFKGELEKEKKAAAEAAAATAAAAAEAAAAKAAAAAAAAEAAEAAAAAAAVKKEEPAEGAPGDAPAGAPAEGADAMAVDEPAQVKAEPAAAADGADAAAAPAEQAEVKQEAAAKPAGVEAEAAAQAATAAAAAAEASAAAAAVAAATPAVSDDEVKAKWMAPRDALYTASYSELEGRRVYEEGIKRSYFHVKPLDASQLTNWLKYLDYVEAKGNNTATMILYERCLVPCASYPEFWERYVRWLEKQGLLEEAAGALQRATITTCRTRPDMHLFAMHYDERHGNIDGARARYKQVLGELAPRLLSATVAAANFERRQGNREAACQLFETLLKEERAKEDSVPKSTLSFLAMQYANFLRVSYRDYAKGRQVLHEALATAPHIKQLWEAAIFYEEACGSEDMVKVVLDLCERASAAPAAASGEAGAKATVHLPDKDREDFSLRAVEFADAHGTAQDLLAAEKRHAAQFMLPANVAAEGRKRHADAVAADAAARPSKAARADTPAAGSAQQAVPHAPVVPPVPAVHPAAAGYYGHAAPHAAAAAPAAYGGYYGAAYPGYGVPPAQYSAAPYPGYGYGY